MKKKDMMRFFDAITPGDELQARILALPKRRSRPKLEKPLQHIAALGVAGLLCAGVVAAVLALQNMAAPGGNNTGFSALSGGTEATQVPAETPVSSPTEAPGLEPSTPKLSQGQDFGVDMVSLDYASDDIVIFHGYFGLFIYDLKSLKIIRSVDLEPIGCNATQGDNYCGVSVSEDGNTVQLHPLSSKNAYIYTVSDNTLRDTVFESMESRFSGLIDPETDAGYQRVYQKFELCSYRAVRFGTGEYGYLRAFEWTVDRLTYVRGDTVYELFKDLPAPSGLPLPSDGNQIDGGNNKFPKLADIVMISEKDGKYYVNNEFYLFIASHYGYVFDAGWIDKLKNGMLTKEEILAEVALADERAANYVELFDKKTLPESIISPDEAITLAKKAYNDYFGIDLGDCVIVDGYSYSQMTLQGRDEPIREESFMGRPVLIARFEEAVPEPGSTDRGPYPYQWFFLFNMDGSRCIELSHRSSAREYTRDMSIIIDGITGYVIGGSIEDTEKVEYTDAEQKERMVLARQYVEKHLLGQAAIKGGSGGSDKRYVSVTLTDGRVILIWINENAQVVGFMTTGLPSDSDTAG